MALELAMGYSRTDSFMENAVAQEAASGLENLQKFVRIFSRSQRHPPAPDNSLELDCGAAAEAAVTKFKRVISLLDRTRTGHARFRRAPTSSPPPQPPCYPSKHHESPESDSIVYCATPLQQIPPAKNGDGDRSSDPGPKNINFSYSVSAPPPLATSFLTSDNHHQSSVFQITNLPGGATAAGKPPLNSSSMKIRKYCSSSENNLSGKCSTGSSGKCHCSKKEETESEEGSESGGDKHEDV